MSSNRIVYQNWIVEIGHDPNSPPGRTGFEGDEPASVAPSASVCPVHNDGVTEPRGDILREPIRRRVKAALEALDEEERELVIRFHFMGESYRRIAQKSGRSMHKLEAMHKRCLKKLRKLLAPFVDETFGLVTEATPDCPICRSPYAAELDEIIRKRDSRGTWRPVMKLLRAEYNLHIGSPQLLIGHEKYH